MLPRWHIFWGAVFTAIIGFFASGISYIYLTLVFLSSIFIDLDHYFCGVTRTKRWNLFHVFDYHKQMEIKQQQEKKKGIRRKGDFHLFHTIEFHALIGLLGIFWSPFFYIFIGMLFHSLLDVFSLIRHDYVYLREYFFFNWLAKRFE